MQSPDAHVTTSVFFQVVAGRFPSRMSLAALPEAHQQKTLRSPLAPHGPPCNTITLRNEHRIPLQKSECSPHGPTREVYKPLPAMGYGIALNLPDDTFKMKFSFSLLALAALQFVTVSPRSYTVD